MYLLTKKMAKSAQPTCEKWQKHLRLNIFALVIFMILSPVVLSQKSEIIFTNDVDTIEYLGLKICISEDGQISSVIENPETSTYNKSKNIVDEIRQKAGVIFHTDEGNDNSECFDFELMMVNLKYQNFKEVNDDCFKYFGIGNFRYLNPKYQDFEIVRNEDEQIEKNADSEMIFKIEWNSPCSYVLSYLEVSDPEMEYLIGQKIDVKIVDILPNESYVYYSNLSDRTIGYGVIQKVR